MKTALAGLGGALAMLLVVAVWQTRTSALQLAPSGSPLTMSSGFTPVGWQPSALAPPVSSDFVQLDTSRAVPASYVAAPAPRRVLYREARPPRNWVKTALVIGGSAGAGAGVGGIAGGKKGALIGAALGGGVASLVEALR